MINIDQFFTQSQIAFALLVIAAALAYLAFGRKMPKKKQKRGNILVILLVTTVVILSLAAVGYLFVQNRQLQNQTIKPIPPVQNSAPTDNFPTPTPISTPAPAIDPTANWKKLTSSKFNYSIKYPNNWFANERSQWNFIDTTFVYDRPIPEGPIPDGIPYAFTITPVADKPNLVPSEKHSVEEVVLNDQVVQKIVLFQGTGIGGPLNTTFVFKRQNGYFLVSFPNSDNFGKHDKIFDQILSTFKFL